MAINFNEAIVVAVVGLIVNLVCAWLLKDDHHHGHDYTHAHAAGKDQNLRAAYLRSIVTCGVIRPELKVSVPDKIDRFRHEG